MTRRDLSEDRQRKIASAVEDLNQRDHIIDSANSIKNIIEKEHDVKATEKDIA